MQMIKTVDVTIFVLLTKMDRVADTMSFNPMLVDFLHCLQCGTYEYGEGNIFIYRCNRGFSW